MIESIWGLIGVNSPQMKPQDPICLFTKCKWFQPSMVGIGCSLSTCTTSASTCTLGRILFSALKFFLQLCMDLRALATVTKHISLVQALCEHLWWVGSEVERLGHYSWCYRGVSSYLLYLSIWKAGDNFEIMSTFYNVPGSLPLPGKRYMQLPSRRHWPLFHG